MTTLRHRTLPAPVGPLSLLAADDRLVACGFTDDVASLQRGLGPALRDVPRVPARDLGGLEAAFVAYFDGEVTALDALEVAQPGSAFLQRAWAALRAVPAGSTVTYGELAARAGSPRAARAAGSACARNLLAPVVPCHRVVPAASGVGHYGYGADVKRWLLDHERRHA